LYFASAVADSGRIAFSCKASRGQKSPRGGLAGWGCCIAFAGGLTCRFAESQTRVEKRSNGSGASNAFTVPW
jgi:hypothetical protein